MHILLTDILACPRCGPEFGLILLAERIEARRVLEGRLGCANCRESYPIRGGEADLRVAAAPSPDVPGDAADAGDSDAATRLAALLGLAEVKGNVLVAGPGAELAAAVAGLLGEVEVVAYRAAPVGGEEVAGVSRVAGGGRLPFRGRSLRGVALTGGVDDALLDEAARVVVAGARILVDPAPEGAADRLRGAGATVLLEQDGVVVARSAGDPVQLRVNAVR